MAAAAEPLAASVSRMSSPRDANDLPLEEMSAALLGWYAANKRDLPWRATGDPYRIWISEIMLQQTRVAAVLEHYRRFLEAFPAIEMLAAASEAEVLAQWSGLGYYRRARMLHRAAKTIVEEQGGAMPRTAEGLRELPGIGAYTAAAVASIAFGEPAAAVDGNVERVLARVAGWAATDAGFATRVRTFAQRLLHQARPDDWNQAVMELGATVCVPRAPLCLGCAWQPWCRTRGEHAMPARRPQQRQHSARLLWLRGRGVNQQVRLVQRPPDAALMAGMWELPLYEGSGAAAFTVRHAITVTNHVVDVCVMRGKKAHSTAGEWTPVSALPQCALTGLARKILRQAGYLAYSTPSMR